MFSLLGMNAQSYPACRYGFGLDGCVRLNYLTDMHQVFFFGVKVRPKW